MADRKAFNCHVVFLTTISHVVWGLCIHYDCGMSDASCYSARAAVHDSHYEHNSSSERIHSDSTAKRSLGFPKSQGSGSILGSFVRTLLVIPCCHGDRHEGTPHQHGLHCIGHCSVYLPKLPSERNPFPFDRSVASSPFVLENPAGLSNVLTAERSAGSGDFRFKRPLHSLLTVLLL